MSGNNESPWMAYKNRNYGICKKPSQKVKPRKPKWGKRTHSQRMSAHGQRQTMPDMASNKGYMIKKCTTGINHQRQMWRPEADQQ